MGTDRRPETRGRESGQGLVEFALVMPVFLLIFFGLIDVGRLVYTNSVLSQAAREGARLAAAEGGWVEISGPACVSDASGITSSRPGAHVCPSDVTAFKSHIADAVERMTVAVGPITDVYISCNAGDGSDPAPSGDWTESSGGNGCQDVSGSAVSSSGRLVSVRVGYTYQFFTPVISSFLNDISLSGASAMTIN